MTKCSEWVKSFHPAGEAIKLQQTMFPLVTIVYCLQTEDFNPTEMDSRKNGLYNQLG